MFICDNVLQPVNNVMHTLFIFIKTQTQVIKVHGMLLIYILLVIYLMRIVFG